MTLLPQVKFPDIIAILPAAGIGSRMNSSFPKQYHTIGNKTLLELSISTLLNQPCIRQVIVAISPNDCWFHRLSLATDPRVSAVTGGETRVESVIAALRYAHRVAWVLVHDAVRPCLHQEDLMRLLAVTSRSPVGGILGTPVCNTVKRVHADSNLIDYTVDRNDLWHALTPQLFNYNLLQRCLRRALAENVVITDEASSLEYYGYWPLLVPGRADNIKVTVKEDLILVNSYFAQFNKNENI